MPLVELPMELAGRVFKSPMPFAIWDPHGRLIHDYHCVNASVIVVLAEDQECLTRAGRSLRHLYAREGFGVISMPIRDFSIPARRDLERAVDVAIQHARAGGNVVVHCYAGLARSVMFLAAFRKRAAGCTGNEALAWIRQWIPNAVETREQRWLVCECFSADAEMRRRNWGRPTGTLHSPRQ